MAKPNEGENRGIKLEQHVAERLAAIRSKLDEQVEVVPQHPVTLTSGRKAVIDFRLSVHFAHETQNYYIEVQSRSKHDHELSDKIEAIRRDTELKTFRFIHDTPLEVSVSRELQSRGVICYDLDGLDRFLGGIEINLTAIARLQAQVERGDKSVNKDLKALVQEFANADKDIAHLTPNFSPHKQRLIEQAVEIAKKNPEAVKRLLGNFLKDL